MDIASVPFVADEIVRWETIRVAQGDDEDAFNDHQLAQLGRLLVAEYKRGGKKRARALLRLGRQAVDALPRRRGA